MEEKDQSAAIRLIAERRVQTGSSPYRHDPFSSREDTQLQPIYPEYNFPSFSHSASAPAGDMSDSYNSMEHAHISSASASPSEQLEQQETGSMNHWQQWSNENGIIVKPTIISAQHGQSQVPESIAMTPNPSMPWSLISSSTDISTPWDYTPDLQYPNHYDMPTVPPPSISHHALSSSHPHQTQLHQQPQTAPNGHSLPQIRQIPRPPPLQHLSSSNDNALNRPPHTINHNNINFSGAIATAPIYPTFFDNAYGSNTISPSAGNANGYYNMQPTGQTPPEAHETVNQVINVAIEPQLDERDITQSARNYLYV